jgi:tetratricopeptide (TPR) repeat protein
MEELEKQLEQERQIWIEGNYSTAYALYEKLLKNYQNSPHVFCDYGLALYAGTEDMERATQLLKHALTLKPDYIVALLGLGELYAIGYGPEGSSVEAIPILQRVIDLAPHNEKARLIAFMQIGLLRQNQEERIAAFQQAIKADPSNASAHENLALEFCLRRSFQEAWNELKLAEQLLSEAKRSTLHIQKALEKVDRKELCKPIYAVESILSPWFSGQMDKW